MSCATNGLKAAACAAHNGLSRIGSKSAFYGALAGGGTLAAAINWRRRSQQKATLPASPPAAALPTLSGPTLVQPLAANAATNRLCQQCGTLSDAKGGSWYQLNASYYCQDCAPAQARKNGLALASAPTSAGSGLDLPALPVYWPRQAATLRAASVESGVTRNLPGYKVLTNGRPSGLSLMPEMQSTPEGQVKVTERWFVNYDLANKPVAGPFRDQAEAHHAAELLCNFNWNRPIDEFNPHEVTGIKAMMKEFRRATATASNA